MHESAGRDSGNPERLSELSPRRIVAAALVVGASGILPVFLFGALVVQIRADFIVGASTIGLLTTAFFGASALCSVTVGHRIDEIGWRRAMILAALCQAVAVLGIGLLASSVPTLLAFLVFGGVAHAIGMPAGNLAIVRNIALRRQALVFGVRQSAIPLAVLLAGLSVPAIGLTVGWRWAFLGAVVGPVVGVMLLTARTGPPGAWTRRAPRVRRESIRSPGLAAMVVATALGGGIVNVSSAFFVASAVDAGTPAATAGILLAVGSVTAIMSRVLIGLVVDRRGSRGFVPMASMLAIGTMGWVMFAVGPPALLWVAAPLAFGAGTGWAGLMHFALVSEHPDNPAAASATVLAFGYTGGAVVPAVFGFVADHAGYTAAWMLATVAAMLAAGLTLLAGRLFQASRTARCGPPVHEYPLPALD